MGTQYLRPTLPLSVQASVLLSALRASPMGSTSLRPPFDDRDYVPRPTGRPVGSAAPKPTVVVKEVA